MGHRRSRKVERRTRRREPAADGVFPSVLVDSAWGGPQQAGSDDDYGRPAFPLLVVGTACGRCVEFVEDSEGGRGTCLHPGSGILAPWTNTPGCDFYAGPGRSG